MLTKKTPNTEVKQIEVTPIANKQNFLKLIGLKKLIIIAFVVLAVCGIFSSIYYYRKYQELKNNPNIEAQKETDALVKVVGKLIELPTGEIPTVATIVDKEKLKDQPFFNKAENGDKLLAYTKAMEVILYRPSINKIVNVAPMVINQPQQNLIQATDKTNSPSTVPVKH